MLAKEIREKSVKELVKLLDETSLEYFKLKMQLTTGQLPTHRQIRNSRKDIACLLYTSPSPRDPHLSRMPSSA